jgi:hypothetical protein
MKRTRHRLSKRDLLGYALDGARFERGTADHLTDDEYDDLSKDIAEIERRIKLVEIAEQKKDT